MKHYLDQFSYNLGIQPDRATARFYATSGTLLTAGYFSLIEVRKKRKAQKEYVAFLEAEMRKKLEQEEQEAAAPQPSADVR